MNRRMVLILAIMRRHAFKEFGAAAFQLKKIPVKVFPANKNQMIWEHKL